MIRHRLTSFIAAAALIAGCNFSAPVTGPGSGAAKVQVSPPSVTIISGQTTLLTAVPLDSSGHPLSGGTVTWRSSDTTIAAVSSSGIVTGLKAGAATISASEAGLTGSGQVTVQPIPVASVAVSPAAPSVSVGSTVQLTATPKDSLGRTLTGRAITWSSNKTTVATVNGSGLVKGIAAGSATITAASEGRSGGATVTVTTVAPPPPPPPPPPAGWPNQPSGMTLLSDWGMDVAVPASGDVSIPGATGWHVVDNAAVGSSRGWTVLASDATAPASPSGVYDFVYPQGMVEGNAPSTVYYSGLNNAEVYVGFYWKASSPFDTGPDGNKIAFIFNGGGGGGGQQFLILLPDGKLHVLPEYPGDYNWRDPNVNATTVTLGAWHKIEWYSNVSTGVLKWWLDGVLQGSYTNVTNPVKFDMFQFSPTWGGNIGAKKKETDHYWFDHVRLVVR